VSAVHTPTPAIAITPAPAGNRLPHRAAFVRRSEDFLRNRSMNLPIARNFYIRAAVEADITRTSIRVLRLHLPLRS
jgi:hypothetical protein